MKNITQKTIAAFTLGIVVGSVTAPFASASSKPKRRGIPTARYVVSASTKFKNDPNITASLDKNAAYASPMLPMVTIPASKQGVENAPKITAPPAIKAVDMNENMKEIKKAEVSETPELPTYYRNFVIPEYVITMTEEFRASNKYGLAMPEVLDQMNHTVTDKTLKDAGIREIIGVSAQEFLDYNPDRKHNMIQAIQAFDGRIVMPGETLSFNETVGEVSYGTGYKRTKIIVNGVETPGLGGGICQMSTAVFQGAWTAGLEINERRNHSLYYSDFYVAGTDATTAKGSPDFVFTNNMSTPVMLQFVQRDNKLYTFFYGTKVGDVELKRLWNSTTEWGGGSTAWQRTITPINGGEPVVEKFESYYKRMRR